MRGTRCPGSEGLPGEIQRTVYYEGSLDDLDKIRSVNSEKLQDAISFPTFPPSFHHGFQ